jgi:ABC-2 type transport system permease protein
MNSRRAAHLALRGSLAIVASAGALATSGCATTGVTAARIERSIAPTYARMYRWKQRLLHASTSRPLGVRAQCARGDADTPDRGAGGNWTCAITFLIAGPGTPVRVVYDMTVRPDGCWTTEGGPPELGGQTIKSSAGPTVPNPIYAIDGCFPAS